MKSYLFLLILFLGFVTCSFEDDNSSTTINPPPVVQDPFNYLALGDSYTIGESVPEEERFPNQLAKRLEANQVRIKEPTILARTGWTTQELQSAIDDAGLPRDYDLVTLLIGVNNQFRRYPIEDYRPSLEGLISEAIAFAGGDTSKVLMVSIPDYAFTPFGQGYASNPMALSQDIDRYNGIKKETADMYGIPFINITEISRRGLDEPDLVAEDKLHPSGKMYGQWAELLLEPAKAILMK